MNFFVPVPHSVITFHHPKCNIMQYDCSKRVFFCFVLLVYLFLYRLYNVECIALNVPTCIHLVTKEIMNTLGLGTV